MCGHQPVQDQAPSTGSSKDGAPILEIYRGAQGRKTRESSSDPKANCRIFTTKGTEEARIAHISIEITVSCAINGEYHSFFHELWSFLYASNPIFFKR
jgi:hypothetical protein